VKTSTVLNVIRQWQMLYHLLNMVAVTSRLVLLIIISQPPMTLEIRLMWRTIKLALSQTGNNVYIRAETD